MSKRSLFCLLAVIVIALMLTCTGCQALTKAVNDQKPVASHASPSVATTSGPLVTDQWVGPGGTALAGPMSFDGHVADRVKVHHYVGPTEVVDNVLIFDEVKISGGGIAKQPGQQYSAILSPVDVRWVDSSGNVYDWVAKTSDPSGKKYSLYLFVVPGESAPLQLQFKLDRGIVSDVTTGTI